MKRNKLKILTEYIYIYIGTLIASIAINAFLVPSNLAPGGATGLSILINYMTGIPVGTLIFIINIPLFIIGVKIFGKSYGAKTLAGISFLSLNVELVKNIVPEIDKVIDFTNPGNIFLGTLYGGLLMGVGIGTVIKNGGTTGGSDIISGIINKFFKIPIGQALILIDSAVVLLAAYIFGAEKALYALINLYTTGIVINKLINGLGNAKMAYIVTSEVEKVRKIIVEDLGKTGNYYQAEGLYSRNRRDVITTVLRNREIFLLKDLIMAVDKEAFVVVSDVHEVLGRGYTFDVDAVKKSRKGK
ncbi:MULTISPECIES: YitT family protein [Cetobacterium]|uniref:YitT family protein n=1 Tax=Candidatus Cetobacterium colombiensis TaxID=3073100 RepID=A0ABU4W9T2_9FUSO|nr:YitT family protein [Candidatus Cetobacterium colombiensis]MDX8335782.1 YitT family protein [Candidatus Cetobacterium colombiensis]